MLKKFSFKGRITRREYIISVTGCGSYLALLAALDSKVDVLIFLIVIPSIIPFYWFLFAQGTKRCHDLGKSGWYQFIPFYIFLMLFSKGQHGINKFDPTPIRGYVDEVDQIGSYLQEETQSQMR